MTMASMLQTVKKLLCAKVLSGLGFPKPRNTQFKSGPLQPFTPDGVGGFFLMKNDLLV